MDPIPDIVTFGEMIDAAFGDPDKNVVHHKLIQAILIILAKQLRMLERKIKLELYNNEDFYSSSSSLSVTEIKIQAIKKKRRTTKPHIAVARGKIPVKGTGAGTVPGHGPPIETGPGRGPTIETGPRKGPTEETGPEPERPRKMTRLEIPRATPETIEDYAKGHISITQIRTKSLPSDPKHGTVYTSRFALFDESESPIQERSTAGRITFLGDDSTSTEKNTSASDPISADKTSTEKSTSGKTTGTPTDKTTTDTRTDKTTTASQADKTTLESRTDKTTTVSRADKTTTKSPIDKLSPEESMTEISTDRAKKMIEKAPIASSMGKGGSDKTTIDQRGTEKSSIEKSASESGKSPSTKTTAVYADKTRTDTMKGKAETDKISTTSSTTKPTKSTPSKTTSSSPKATTSDKRADSREERDKTPTPMTSMDSVEVQYEKLLVVERVPSKEAKARVGRLQGETRGSAPTLSIVTQEEFSKLATVVRQLQAKFDPIGMAEFPENIELMQELRKGASLTDAMAALQLSARLEAAEKALGRMTSLVTELATKYPDVDLTQLTELAEPETKVLYHGAPGISSQEPPRLSKIPAFKQPPKPDHGKSKTSKLTSKHGEKMEETTSAPTVLVTGQSGREHEVGPFAMADEDKDGHWVTSDQLDNALQDLYVNTLEEVQGIVTKSRQNADTALKIANRLEGKLDASLNVGDRMTGLETLVAEYAEKINNLDTGLSSQMTNYQELLTQMQHDLETGLENMAEVLATTGGDTTAVAELNSHFTNLQLDFEITNARQTEFRDIQTGLRSELDDLKHQIEVLRGTKSDRDEVADALRDKVGLGTLNGLISSEQFDAVRGDLEQRIRAAYDKFNNQELVWQRAIDDIFRDLSEKADWTQIVFLREDIKKNIEKLQSRVQAMLDIVGEPQAAAVSRRLYRDTNCLSCSTPAHMGLEEDTVPKLPAMPGARPPTLGAESPPKQDGEHGDHGVCYPHLPIPHPRDPRAHICHRYCGGSHTKLPPTLPRAPPCMIINPGVGQSSGDAKTYIIKKPCLPCNKKSRGTCDVSKFGTEERKISRDVKEAESVGSYQADLMRLSAMKSEGSGDANDETPPVPQDEN